MSTDCRASVLVVDDDALVREVLSRRLNRAGYATTRAASGAEALDLIQHHPFDLGLLDVEMPGISGYEVRRIRETTSAGALPVVMVTANDRSEDVVEALALGANDYIVKPVDRVLSASLRKPARAQRRPGFGQGRSPRNS